MHTVTILASIGILLVLGSAALADDKPPATQPASVLNFQARSIDGRPVDLTRYKGKVLLIVNTASKCGYTPQYAQLESLYNTYKDKGLAILAFPANQFGGQEPGTDQQIQAFCSTTYGVSFDLFSKIVVKGENQHPLYQYLTSQETNPRFGGAIKWNFTKFLISRDGQVAARFEPKTAPDAKELIEAVEAELAKK